MYFCDEFSYSGGTDISSTLGSLMTDTSYTGSAPAKLNTLSIVAIIGGFLVPLVGIVLGFFALRQIKETGERGHGLAMAGIIVGIALTVIYALIGIIGAVAGAAISSGY
ncbi:hypothetical protein B7R21_02750 [Subtercola boreus]|uniref:DUF4190 domain-containing protein n=2 Tax=Subtercola boreus TaxID=120213 RepID=A0A3E0W475_9MICO|nr:hypothetical protein B7R21_02750 [Subtercola boreus]